MDKKQYAALVLQGSRSSEGGSGRRSFEEARDTPVAWESALEGLPACDILNDGFATASRRLERLGIARRVRRTSCESGSRRGATDPVENDESQVETWQMLTDKRSRACLQSWTFSQTSIA